MDGYDIGRRRFNFLTWYADICFFFKNLYDVKCLHIIPLITVNSRSEIENFTYWKERGNHLFKETCWNKSLEVRFVSIRWGCLKSLSSTIRPFSSHQTQKKTKTSIYMEELGRELGRHSIPDCRPDPSTLLEHELCWNTNLKCVMNSSNV